MRVFNILILMMLSLFARANSAEDLFYSNGKIYVVVAILVIIFSTIVVYLVRLDKKIKNLEDKNEA